MRLQVWLLVSLLLVKDRDLVAGLGSAFIALSSLWVCYLCRYLQKHKAFLDTVCTLLSCSFLLCNKNKCNAHIPASEKLYCYFAPPFFISNFTSAKISLLSWKWTGRQKRVCLMFVKTHSVFQINKHLFWCGKFQANISQLGGDHPPLGPGITKIVIAWLPEWPQLRCLLHQPCRPHLHYFCFLSIHPTCR